MLVRLINRILLGLIPILMVGVVVCASGSTIQYEKISARDILDKAKDSPMIYDRVAIIGDL